jgi:hypothetical protein
MWIWRVVEEKTRCLQHGLRASTWWCHDHCSGNYGGHHDCGGVTCIRPAGSGALQWEVASCSDPCPWSEGQEESAMDRMSTIVVKPERREQKPLHGTLNVEVVSRYFHWHSYKSSPLWFVIGGTKALVHLS